MAFPPYGGVLHFPLRNFRPPRTREGFKALVLSFYGVTEVRVNKTMIRVTRALTVLAILAMAPLPASSQAATQLQVTPANGYYSSGPQGGPFNPGVQIFTMTNTGAAPLDFTVSANQP